MSGLEEIEEEDERNVAIPEFNEEGMENTKFFDLNKVFQMKLSYNFDILKELIESLISSQNKIQKELNKIPDLEKKLLDFKIMLTNTLGDKEAVQKLESEKSKINKQMESSSIEAEKPQQPAKSSQKSSGKVKKGNIHPPSSDVKLEIKIGYDDITNKIIVSKINFYFLFFYEIYRKK